LANNNVARNDDGWEDFSTFANVNDAINVSCWANLADIGGLGQHGGFFQIIKILIISNLNKSHKQLK